MKVLPNISTLMRTSKMSKSLENANILLMLLVKIHFFAFSLSLFLYIHKKQQKLCCASTAWKVSKYGVFSGPYFPAFELNTERYSSLRIPYSVRMRENTDQKKLRIRTLFTQWDLRLIGYWYHSVELIRIDVFIHLVYILIY